MDYEKYLDLSKELLIEGAIEGMIDVLNDPYPYSKWQVPSMLFDGISFSGL